MATVNDIPLSSIFYVLDIVLRPLHIFICLNLTNLSHFSDDESEGEIK